MSDSELLRIRVQVQRALATMSRPRTERDADQITAALEQIDEALRQLRPGTA